MTALPPVPAGRPPLRIVSYNINSRRGDAAALDEVVRELAPDVLVLQEAPRRFRWRQKCADLARRFRLVVAAGGQPGLGNLILTDLRVRVRETWYVRFPLTPGRHLRGAVFARCEVGGASLVVAGSHLSTDPLERPGQARLLRQELSAVADPVVLAADVNDEPGSESWKVLADGLVAAGDGAPTFSCAAPRRRIDAVFADPRLPVAAGRVADTAAARRASDHFPVVAELRLPPGVDG